ncbi:predicted protein [Pyrenophora tritici-repentis Pt-1C-BFP]|uniref:Uncharacterized protein n=1 Tax=Pyrenophora tritici-repentis (strain Pt-1C-BFP) TaxID=426418 RepID=B2WL32_PYRTR|nr:uncharacterized protein PTRG_10692 [Pyrenophora tritici-repentis Pt-1C-BFP]EDU43742.1 predicted protein [Pyrenophora tritici-repentis Pt-1C-BFP]
MSQGLPTARSHCLTPFGAATEAHPAADDMMPGVWPGHANALTVARPSDRPLDAFAPELDPSSFPPRSWLRFW